MEHLDDNIFNILKTILLCYLSLVHSDRLASRSIIAGWCQNNLTLGDEACSFCGSIWGFQAECKLLLNDEQSPSCLVIRIAKVTSISRDLKIQIQAPLVVENQHAIYSENIEHWAIEHSDSQIFENIPNTIGRFGFNDSTVQHCTTSQTSSLTLPLVSASEVATLAIRRSRVLSKSCHSSFVAMELRNDIILGFQLVWRTGAKET